MHCPKLSDLTEMRGKGLDRQKIEEDTGRL